MHRCESSAISLGVGFLECPVSCAGKYLEQGLTICLAIHLLVHPSNKYIVSANYAQMHAEHWGRGGWPRQEPVLAFFAKSTNWGRRQMFDNWMSEVNTVGGAECYKSYGFSVTVLVVGVIDATGTSLRKTRLRTWYKQWAGFRRIRGGGQKLRKVCVSPRARRKGGRFRNRNKTRTAGVEETRGEWPMMKLERLERGQILYIPVFQMRGLKPYKQNGKTVLSTRMKYFGKICLCATRWEWVKGRRPEVWGRSCLASAVVQVRDNRSLD